MAQGSAPPPPRRSSLITEGIHDPYKAPYERREPTVCPDCGAVWRAGRWHWIAPPDDAHEARCQACHRIADRCPAGEVVIAGTFARARHDEVLALVWHEEKLDKSEQPLHRIMGIDWDERGLVVTTTDIHLPCRIGEALHRAYGGELDVTCDEESYVARVLWGGTSGA